MPARIRLVLLILVTLSLPLVIGGIARLAGYGDGKGLKESVKAMQADERRAANR